MPIILLKPKEEGGFVGMLTPTGLRQANQQRLKAGKQFQHPDYPPPFDQYPRCCYEGYDDLFGHLPRSDVSDLVRASPDTDPYSVYNLDLAQRAIDRYRSAVPYPQWSTRIAEYPVPDWMNKLTDKLVGSTYSQIEIDAGWRIEWYFDLVMDLLPLRALTLGCLRGEEDPITVLGSCLKTHQKKPIEDIQKYLLAIARKNGERPPAEPRGDHPVTQIVRPSLADAIPGWEPGTPGYDEEFARETDAFIEDHDQPWWAILDDTEVGNPDQTPEEWVSSVRSTLDPHRAKQKADKLNKWRR